MNESTIKRTTRFAEAHLFDPQHVETMLRSIIQWPGGARPRNVMIERCWPTRDERFVFEWSFDLAGRGRRVLFGKTGPTPDGGGGPCLDEARDTPWGLGCVHLYSAPWGVMLYTPDCDPAMPHLQRCLDSTAMTGHLGQSWMWLNGHEPAPPSRLTCRSLGYRPERRATIAYRASSPGRTPSTLVGKTHINGRVHRLRSVHEQLNAQLSVYSCGRVRVPTFLGELPDLRMALFCEVRGDELGEAAQWSSYELDRVVGALTALHRSRIDELGVFSVADEMDVIRRWRDFLVRTHHADAGGAGDLVDGLGLLSERIDPAPRCLVHRDFYERQLIIGRHATAILDLDTLAMGQPCLDLGNLLAHVFQAFLLRGSKQNAFESLAAELIRRYEQCGELPVDRRILAFYFASALFRVGAVHAMRTRTRRSSPAMWAAAAEVIRNSSGPVRRARFRFLAPDPSPAFRTTMPRHTTIAMESLQ